MDRAQELRSLMKQGNTAVGGSAVSGKDKAKMLKMMKEQQRQKEAVVPKTAKPISTPQIPSGMPSDFFDSVPMQPPLEIKIAPAPVQPAKAPATTNGIKNLPQGFFDNPVEDLNARGITMEQYTAKLEKEEQSALDSFLSDLKGLEGERSQLEEASAAQEEGNREYEEEAMQMAYMANLIALRAQSERIVSNNSAGSVEETEEVLGKLLKEVGQARDVSGENNNTAASAVGTILYQKLAQNMVNKRKRDAILSTVLNPTSGNIVGKIGSNEGEGEGSEDGSDDEDDDKDEDDDEDDDEGSSEGSGSEDSKAGSKKAKTAAAAAKYSPLNYMDWMSRSV